MNGLIKLINGQLLRFKPVNIAEHGDGYLVSPGGAGLKRDDFIIEVDGNLITILIEKKKL